MVKQAALAVGYRDLSHDPVFTTESWDNLRTSDAGKAAAIPYCRPESESCHRFRHSACLAGTVGGQNNIHRLPGDRA